MSGLAVHFAHEFRAGLRNSSQLLMNYLFPLAFYALMGAVMTKINPGFKATLVPAMAVFSVMVASLLGLPSPIVEAREAGIFRSYRTIGVPAGAILAMPGLTTVFHSLIAATIIVLTGPALFGGTAPTNALGFAGVLLLAAFAFVSIALLIGVVARSARSTVMLSQAIFLPSMMLGGLMVPISMLPASIRQFSALLPSTHIMQAMDALAFGHASAVPAWQPVLVLASAGVLALVLAALLFEWDSRGGTRRAHPALALLVAVPFVIAAVAG